jgi:DNA-binding transcriptional ArsR family regulator
MTALIDPSLSRRYLRHGMLPQLAAFEAVVRLGSATHTAEALCMAQPTLSGHLRKLSEALGARLFELKGKRLVPTDAALVLLHAAREVFAPFAHCERVLAGVRAGLRVSGPSQSGTDGLGKADGLSTPPVALAATHAGPRRASRAAAARVLADHQRAPLFLSAMQDGLCGEPSAAARTTCSWPIR